MRALQTEGERCICRATQAALTREKIVAAMSRRFVILVGEEKLVTMLGEHGNLPVEVVPFALTFCRRRLKEMGLSPEPYRRAEDGELFLTDNGNHILDCGLGPILVPARLENDIRAIPGVVGTREATGRIADGVRVRVDGDAGEVRVVE